MPCQLHGDGVAGLQEEVDHDGGQADLAAADFVQERFQLVGHHGEVRETEDAGSTLDGVGGAKQGVQFLAVGAFRVQGNEDLLHLCQVLGTLLEKSAVEAVQVDGGVVVMR